MPRRPHRPGNRRQGATDASHGGGRPTPGRRAAAKSRGLDGCSNPDDQTIPGIRPGVETTFYLKQIMQRVTYLGAIMLSILATIPNFIEAIIPGSSFNGLGTTSLLILVGVILDLSREIRSIILSNIYNEMFE